MKTTFVRVRWPDGLHLRPAVKIVQVAQCFHSKVCLKLGSHVASATSVLNLLILCASLNSVVEIEAHGDDEQDALDAVAQCFESLDDGVS